MVYCGKPSGGCENCRKLHKKCDERRPECSRCVKTKRKCAGYRDQSDLIFRDETTRTRERHRQETSTNYRSRFYLSDPKASTVSLLDMIPASYSHTNMGLSRSLYPPAEDIAICHFYHGTDENLSDADPTRYLHQQLPHLHLKSNQGSILRLAVEAISYAASAKLVPKASQLSRKRYVQAVTALRLAIQDSDQVLDDQTLYSVLLLCGYETMTFQSGTPSAWGAHVDGAAALVKLKANGNLGSLLSRSMFCFVRKSVVLSQMQLSQPVDDIFSHSVMASFEDPENCLISTAAKIPDLQYQSSQLGTPEGIERTKAERLLCHARQLDFELSSWTKRIPLGWSYAIALNVNSNVSSEFSPHVIHRYTDVYTARVWNIYRVSRLILQSILLRTVDCSPPSTHAQSGVDRSGVERKSMELVDDICASVPFLLGHDLSKMKLNFTDIQRHNWAASGSAANINEKARNGRFSLIWPLHVACSVSSAPETQREWIRRQLQDIAERGEPLASAVCMTESQMLLGSAEKFRFDCV